MQTYTSIEDWQKTVFVSSSVTINFVSYTDRCPHIWLSVSVNALPSIEIRSTELGQAVIPAVYAIPTFISDPGSILDVE
ncbi:hypothetical protein JXM67_10985 [candidate division WOR-3 bacterium]|nr:hypothetical protein [candidate division WOR-3 bacterium]